MATIVDSMVNYASALSPSALCQIFYVTAAAGVLAVAVTPESAQRLLTQYGARSSSPASKKPNDQAKEPKEPKEHSQSATQSLSIRFISLITSVGNVPHSWFIHFYIVSLSCSIFWAMQYVYHGRILDYIARNEARRSSSSAMTNGQVVIVWSLMCMQGGRRLYECLTVLRPSSSKMWIAHWLLGNAFYLCTSIAIWIEGSKSIQQGDRRLLEAETPPFRALAGVPLFLAAWVMQYRCHQYLSGLTKYSLPDDGLFRFIVCPHYTCECLLYLSLAVIGAPEHEMCNKSLLCVVLFVSTNLGITAHGTKRWYQEKFGNEVQARWKMIPGVF
ncbi:hypothetical protein F4780DRAFT_758372 [Xylariomycetidae sp. FL0641]|nr:hypothetical protein F4780DRAFT_758372 [Xylariomycetidae sp. FL0641]